MYPLTASYLNYERFRLLPVLKVLPCTALTLENLVQLAKGPVPLKWT